MNFIVKGAGKEHLLAAGIIPAGTGDAQAQEVADLLKEWQCSDQLSCACADTTSSNTGCFNGAVVKLEEKLGKVLVFLACRHHALETIPKHIFDKFVEASSSADIGTLSKDFKKKWDSMNHEQFRPGITDPECQNVLTNETVEKVLSFCMETLKVRYLYFGMGRGHLFLVALNTFSSLFQRPMIRCDYKNLLELVIIFLGEIPPSMEDGVHFAPPIALSSARFMGRIIYTLTIHMFALTGNYSICKRKKKFNSREYCC